MSSEDPGILTTQWDGYLREGPGAATTAVPVVAPPAEEGMVLEPEYKRMPIGPDHILYPILIGLASFLHRFQAYRGFRAHRL